MSVEMQQPSIAEMLKDVGKGRVQLPDFQREYRWDVERIRELLVTMLRGHPMGVVMVLQTGSDQVRFKPKPLTGVAFGGHECDTCAERFHSKSTPVLQRPDHLLLDGQQRLTSLYQALSGDGVVHSADDKGKIRHVRYFLDVEKSVGDAHEQDEAVVVLPQDGIERTNFGRDIVRDCSQLQGQVEHGLMPMTALFDDGPDGAVTWMLAYMAAAPDKSAQRTALFTTIQAKVLSPIKSYQIPGIELLKDTTREAVATVFEKVNTGGLALDTFELLTATFAGDPDGQGADGSDFRLVDDWRKTEEVISRHPRLGGFQRIFFLQAVTLLVSRTRRASDIAEGRSKPRPTTARKDDILRLRLSEYLEWADKVREALPWVAQFLTDQHIHREADVPYPTQTVPLVALRVLLGDKIDKYAVRERVARWYWCGVLGEQYGSTTETRFARDVDQVPAWALAPVSGADAPAPETVVGASFAESRLLSLKTRNSAAYKGIYALLMHGGCKDWQFNQDIDHASFSEMQVDIHHVFPKQWCLDNDIDPAKRESIVNKTPLARKTNIQISAKSPAEYVLQLEQASGLGSASLDSVIASHHIDPVALRSGVFDEFFDARRAALVSLIEGAMGKRVVRDLEMFDVQEYAIEDDEPEPIDEEL